jgi:Fe-Mn family superoxide dismutase
MTLTRRTALALAGGTAAALAAPRIARAAAPFEQPPLPYAEDALEPVISARTVGLHYGRHHAGYFETLNERVQGTPYADMTLEEVVAESGRAEDRAIFSQAGQAWNHVLYWEQFAGGPSEPEGAFAEAVERDFGGLAGLKEAIGAEAGRVFGSGWVWLAELDGSLIVAGYEDAGNPVPEGRRTLMGVDVWEHAYYLDYENRRAEHVAAVLDGLVNWGAVGERMGG